MLPLLIELIGAVAALIGLLYFNKTVYAILGFFTTRKFPKAKKLHRYGVLIAARNEEAVIGNLIDSIQKQDYPRELVDIFVAADNCTDQTAAVAARAGAICYERFDDAHRTKGYALQFLVERIRRDYGIGHYDGYFIFDADNLLKHDYISRMNEAFDAGEKVVTSYRNIKNFDAGCVAASYGIHWLRTIRMEHRARSVLRMATRVQGTGYLFASELIREGWKFTSLTEDRAFCAEAVANGYRISYNHQAEFYDEQPEALTIALRQRLRWAKGNLIVTCQTGPRLLWHILSPRKSARPDKTLPWWKRLGQNVYLRLLSADMLTIVFPRSLTGLLRRIAVYLLRIAMVFSTGYAFVTMDLAGKTVRAAARLLGWSMAPGSPWQAVAMLTVLGVLAAVTVCLERMLCAAYILFMERRHIPPMPWYKWLWYCVTFPMFDTIGKLSCLVALFIKVEWKPIPHNAAIAIEEIPQK